MVACLSIHGVPPCGLLLSYLGLVSATRGAAGRCSLTRGGGGTLRRSLPTCTSSGVSGMRCPICLSSYAELLAARLSSLLLIVSGRL